MIWMKLLWSVVLKHWRYFALLAVALTVFLYWHGRTERIHALEAQNMDLQIEVQNLLHEREKMLGAIRSQNEAIGDWMNRASEFEKRVIELQLREPERVTEIKEVVREVERGITAQDCVDAISQAADIINGLKND